MERLTNEGVVLPSIADDFYLVANDVWTDEPALMLSEFDLRPADGTGLRRYQQIHVRRGNRLAEFTLDLGPAHLFTANGFVVVGGTRYAHPQDCETVASIRDYADEIRARGGFKHNNHEPTVTQESWVAYAKENERRRRHRSTFGSAATIVR